MIAEEEFCFGTSNHVVGLENLIKNGGVDNEIFRRIPVVGMGGIGNITPGNCSFLLKTSFWSVFKEYCSNSSIAKQLVIVVIWCTSPLGERVDTNKKQSQTFHAKEVVDNNLRSWLQLEYCHHPKSRASSIITITAYKELRGIYVKVLFVGSNIIKYLFTMKRQVKEFVKRIENEYHCELSKWICQEMERNYSKSLAVQKVMYK